MEPTDRNDSNDTSARRTSESKKEESRLEENSVSCGRSAFVILGVIAEFQRNTIVKNVKMGMKQRARKGKWNGGTVLGYDVVEVESGRGKDSVLKINHIEAELVRKIFRMYGSGQGLRSIANQLNAEGFKTKPGNVFSSVAVKTIINNPVYIGKILYNVRENWNEKRRKGTNKDPIVVDCEHEPIISLELWDAVQKFYKKKAVSAPRKFDGIYLLTGLMRCPQCGATLVAHRINDTLMSGENVVRRYYICSNFRNKGSRVCNSVKADFAERYVIERIAAVIQTPKLLDDIVVSLNKSRSKSVAPLQKELAAIERELKTLDSQKQRYFALYESDTIDNDILVEHQRIEVEVRRARKPKVRSKTPA